MAAALLSALVVGILFPPRGAVVVEAAAFIPAPRPDAPPWRRGENNLSEPPVDDASAPRLGARSTSFLAAAAAPPSPSDAIDVTAAAAAATDGVPDWVDLVDDAPGRVANVTDWIRWSDESLRRLSPDGRGIYERINGALSADGGGKPRVFAPEDVDACARFVVISHGNQTDPVFNYVNAAGRDLFRWPEDWFYRLPSRFSAPDGGHREIRSRVHGESVVRDIVHIPEGVRVRYPDERVRLTGIILFNVYDDEGRRVGQTAVFDADKVTVHQEIAI